MPEPLFTVDDLQVEFRTADGVVPAVVGVSYTLEPGEVLAILCGEHGGLPPQQGVRVRCERRARHRVARRLGPGQHQLRFGNLAREGSVLCEAQGLVQAVPRAREVAGIALRACERDLADSETGANKELGKTVKAASDADAVARVRLV